MITLSAIPARILFILLFLPVICLAAETNPETPTDIAERLQHRYDGMKSLTFNFFQNTSGEMAGRAKKGAGRAFFSKGGGKGQMRWDYTSPDRQVLVSDGKIFSMYFSNLNQMIVTPADTLNKELTYSFFMGTGNLKTDFHVLPAENSIPSENEQEIAVIKLVPKTVQSQVQDIHLWVSTESLIRRMKIRDHFGTVTVLNFSDIDVDSLEKIDPQKRADLFNFVPPEGTEIIRQ